jgi:DNA recombination protein RmuC
MSPQIITALGQLIILFILGFIVIKTKKNVLSRIDTLANNDQIQQRLLEQLLIRLDEREKNLKDLRDHLMQLLNENSKEQITQRTRFDEHQIQTLKTLQEGLQFGMSEIRKQITDTLNNNTEHLGKKVDKLTFDTDQRLKEISGQVDKRLAESFEKTTATFTDVVKRLALIDEAQKKITELSANVVSLQEVLTDKRSRGVFGEVQLAHLISNVLPEKTYELQYTLSNGKRVDALLFLPEPTGNIAIDAKFPLESFRRCTDISLSEQERKIAENQFRIDIRKHIQDIAQKYIILGETSDGAVMFIPAEAVFAEIHAHYPELVDDAHASRVWMVSPTTMVAILNTARAVLKDAATRQQVHIIREHLIQLGGDFERFQKRIDNLARHIEQAHNDVGQVHASSKKITSRFNKIELVELESVEVSGLPAA